jgi:hypothetical protein
VEKILTTELSISVLLTSKRSLALTSQEMLVLFVVLELNAKRQNVFYLQPIKLKLNAKHLLMVKITPLQFPVLSLKNFALIYSENACLQ